MSLRAQRVGQVLSVCDREMLDGTRQRDEQQPHARATRE